MTDDELIKALDDLGYSILFNSLSDAVKLEWGGTAISISVMNFISSLEKRLKERHKGQNA